MNTNYYFNELNDLPEERHQAESVRRPASAAPITIPGLFDGRDKAFFFVNYEQLRFPNSFTRTRVTLHPRALDGWFRYTVSGQVREVNVLQSGGAATARSPPWTRLVRRCSRKHPGGDADDRQPSTRRATRC